MGCWVRLQLGTSAEVAAREPYEGVLHGEVHARWSDERHGSCAALRGWPMHYACCVVVGLRQWLD